MSTYKKIDLETWPRRSHWNYYRNIVKAAIAMTAKVDVTPILDYCHSRGLSFSPVLLHAIAKTVNSLDCMKMFVDEEGNPAVWDLVHPNFTIFHKDDETFSDVWIEYMPDRDEFIQNYQKVIEEYGSKHGIKVRDGQPPNFFPVSGIPWVTYDSFNSYTTGGGLPMLFPVLNYGKYENIDGRYLMPVSITISHAAMDGYHIGRFFEELQKNLNEHNE